MQETTSVSPISTNLRATDFRVSVKYANMSNSKPQRMPESFSNHNVTESVNCPFHYTEGYKRIRNRRHENVARLGDVSLSLVWNGQAGS